MGNSNGCKACDYELRTGTNLDTSKSKTAWAEIADCSEASIRRHFKHAPRATESKISSKAPERTTYRFEYSENTVDVTTPATETPQTKEDADRLFREKGLNPDDYLLDYRFAEWEAQKKGGEVIVMHSQRVYGRKKTPQEAGQLDWIPVQPAAPVVVNYTGKRGAPALTGQWKTVVATADHQIGFRDDEPFHDDRAINIAHQIVDLEQPDQILYLGDYLDLPSQSRWEQEPGFAGTTQRALDYGHELLAIDRDIAPKAEIVLIEGNHDRRMQKFIATNAMAAYGLKRANYPDSWPVMSIPYLLRLDELDVKYIDAYPAGMWWVNPNLRAIHGDKVRSGASTASAYTNSTPHISTMFGHTHRLEVQAKTILGTGGTSVHSMSINPGAMCRIDGEVPSVHGAVGIDGKAARLVEDWQNGLVVVRYKDSGEFFVDGLVQIRDGVTVYRGEELHG